MVYDTDSGLVYTETVVSASSSACSCLKLHDCQGKKPYKTTHHSGARRMGRMISKNILRKLDLLNAESVRTAPVWLVEKLWNMIKKEELDSVRMWQIFLHSAYKDQLERDRKWSGGCRKCLPHLPAMLKSADSASSVWLTDLNLGDAGLAWLQPEHLLCIAELRNVRHISLTGNADLAFNDRILRAWAKAAERKGAFSKLEALFVESHHKMQRDALTHWSLGYLRYFPLLETICLRYSVMESKYTYAGTRIGCFVSGRGPFTDYMNTKAVHPQSAARASHMRRTHSIDPANPFWSDTVRGYIQQRRKRADGKPVLEVTVGVTTTNSRRFNQSDVSCFERDWTPWVPTRLEVAPWDVGEDGAEMLSGRPAASKRRKVRDGRAVDVGDVLGGL